jgi:hypothetical protein
MYQVPRGLRLVYMHSESLFIHSDLVYQLTWGRD